MKYIRTNDSIRPYSGHERTLNIGFEIKQVGIIDDDGEERFVSPNAPYFKSADAIEELCDAWIADYHVVVKPVIIYYSQSAEEAIREAISHGCAVYGAIWVKGKCNEPILKAVCRINEKGEFELL